MKKLIYSLLAAVCVLSSCVKDQEMLFDKSATVRLNEALANAQKVLTSATNGWVMHYYPEGDQIYGGFMHTMVFTESEVTVRSELFDGEYTSLYKMTRDYGPVLSFDTDNYAFHYFATPSGSMKNEYGESGLYQAYKGDFEFMILKATPEEVILKGKRTGNHIHMYPLAESPAQFIGKVDGMVEDLFVSSFSGTAGEADAMTLYLALGSRQATFKLTGDQYKDEEGNPLTVSSAYLYTPEGISFYKPVEVGPYTIEEMNFDVTAKTLSSTGISLKGELPEGWHAYNDFIGTYTLKFNTDKEIADIEIKADVNGKSYIISGLSEAFDVAATYDLGLGRIHIQAQYVASAEQTGTGYQIMMAAHDNAAGKVNYTTGGMYGILDEAGNSIAWVQNGLWSGNKCSGFVLYNFTTSGSRASGSDANTSAPWIWKGLTGSQANRTPYWTSFDRQ
ncbi:MAG: DUF4302 domain-containing protein [Bacteroidales bacterium]|nr:DUF4302 domain-containing protein [Bacteroidales bacterium]